MMKGEWVFHVSVGNVERINKKRKNYLIKMQKGTPDIPVYHWWSNCKKEMKKNKTNMGL